MGDNGIAGPPAKKRGASRQISKDDSSDSEGGSSAPLESRSFQKAPEEVLASRRIVKVRRTPVSAAAAAPNPFAGIRLVAPPMVVSTLPASEGGCSKDAAATPSEVDENEPGSADEVEDGGKDKQHAGNEVGDGGIDKQHVGEGVQDVGIDRQDGKATGSATVAEECGMEKCDGESEENTGILKGEGGDYQPVLVASKEGGLGDGYGAKVQPDGGNGDDQPVLLAATHKGSLVGDDSEGQPDGEGKDKTEVNQSGSSEQISEAKVQNLAAPLVPSPSDKGASISLLTPLGKAFPGSFSFGTAPLSSETPTGFASFSSTWATFGSGSASGTSSGSAFAFKAASEGAFSTQSTAFGSSNGSTFQLFSTQTSTSSLTAAPSSQPPASSIQFQEVPVQTGEEQEKVVFGADATLFEFVDGSWKERGKGELKVNVPEDKLAKPRLLMRAKGNYKLLLNAGLFADMKMTSMDSRGVTFACVNSVAEGKNGLTTYAVKFKDGLSAGNFRDAVDAHKSVPHGGLKTPENSPRALHEC